MRKLLIPMIIALLLGALGSAAVDIFKAPNHILWFGLHDTLDKIFVFDNNGGNSNPAIRMHAGTLQFSNDGVSWFNFSSVVPTGATTSFTGMVAPSGWYLEDGTSYPASGDTTLYFVIGTRYGTSDGTRLTGTTHGTTTITVATCAGVSNGMYVASDKQDVPSGTTVISCSSPNLVISAAATASNAGQTIHIANHFNVPNMVGLTERGYDPTGINDPDNSLRFPNNTGGDTTNELGSQQADMYASHNHTFTQWTQSGQFNGGGPAIGSGTFLTSTNNSGGNETRGKNVSFNFIIKR